MASRIQELISGRRREVLQPRSAGVTSGGGSPLTTYEGWPKARVAGSELEQIYRSDAIAFSIVNRFTNAITAPGYSLQCKDPEQEHRWNEWMMEVRFKRNIQRAVRNAWIYGNGYIELVMNRAQNNIVKLSNVYPPTMDFQKDKDGRIILELETKEPVGFTQTIVTKTGKKGINIPRENIAHLKIVELGEGHGGISPFEPLYKAEIIHLNIDEAMGESAFRQAFPIYVAYVGNQDHDPTLQELDETHKEILKVGQKSVFTLPWYTRLERIESPNTDAVARYADYFLDVITAGTGFPRALLIPTPRVTYAALERQGIEYEKQVKEFQEFLEEQIEDQVFRRMVAINPEFTEIPLFKFKDVSPSMQLSKSRRLATLARAGLLVWDKKLEAWLRQLEDLPPIDEETHLGRPMISVNLSEEDEEQAKENTREMLEEIMSGNKDE